MAYQFENVKLEKGMYREAGRSFTETLERLDPDEAYKGTSLEGLDAFQRQLKRFDIKAKGAGSDVVEKFFATSQSAVLFPEYISRTVRQGMEEADILPAITATTTKIDGMDYRSITSIPDAEDKKLRRVEEGAMIPATTVKTQENLVKLHKRGRMLVASYEAVRYQKLDLFSVTLRQIGAHIARTQLEDAIGVLMNGDGNNNPAAVDSVAASGTLTYDDLVDFWAKFDPYEMNTLLVPSDVMVKMLKLDEFQNPLTGLNFQGTGKLTTPLGAKLLRTSALPAGKIIGLDSRYALEMVKGGEVTVEYDKLIDRQLERAAITSVAGFAKLFTDAARVLTV
jgi:HK97 family phage major capsid protein